MEIFAAIMQAIAWGMRGLELLAQLLALLAAGVKAVDLFFGDDDDPDGLVAVA